MSAPAATSPSVIGLCAIESPVARRWQKAHSRLFHPSRDRREIMGVNQIRNAVGVPKNSERMDSIVAHARERVSVEPHPEQQAAEQRAREAEKRKAKAADEKARRQAKETAGEANIGRLIEAGDASATRFLGKRQKAAIPA
jgi:hypothetical protein